MQIGTNSSARGANRSSSDECQRIAARLPFEVLDHVRHIDLRAVDARFGKSLVEQRSGRADERAAFDVFRVAGLLADEHHRRALFPFAEDGLRSGLPEMTGPAAGRGFLKFLHGGTRRDERRRGLDLLRHHRWKASTPCTTAARGTTFTAETQRTQRDAEVFRPLCVPLRSLRLCGERGGRVFRRSATGRSTTRPT